LFERQALGLTTDRAEPASAAKTGHAASGYASDPTMTTGR